MRLWSIHPRYLDRQGLLALWREGLLAQKVLAGNTKGYKHHPQLIRFQETTDPLAYIGSYLDFVEKEAGRRNYQFNRLKILNLLPPGNIRPIHVTRGQLKFESEHLMRKLKIRDPGHLRKWIDRPSLSAHPLFRAISGEIQSWERRPSK